MKPARIVNGIDVSAHGGLVARCVRRYRGFIGGCLEWEDRMQVGWLGVYEAARRFDRSKGFQFSTYAHFWIRQCVRRAIMDQRRTVRVPVHAQEKAHQLGKVVLNSLSLNRPVHQDHDETWLDMLRAEGDSESAAEKSDLEERVAEAVDALSERHRRIIRSRYWRDRTLSETADGDVSRERIRQLESEALKLLRADLCDLEDAP